MFQEMEGLLRRFKWLQGVSSACQGGPKSFRGVSGSLRGIGGVSEASKGVLSSFSGVSEALGAFHNVSGGFTIVPELVFC